MKLFYTWNERNRALWKNIISKKKKIYGFTFMEDIKSKEFEILKNMSNDNESKFRIFFLFLFYVNWKTVRNLLKN